MGTNFDDRRRPSTRVWRRLSRAASAAPPPPGPPFRVWLTGSLAVVMAALIPLREVAASERSGAMRLLRHSRFDVHETLARIESTARGDGLCVLARLRGESPVLVLASSLGGTPIAMDEADSPPAAALGLVIRGDRRGGADVLGLAAAADWSPLPDAVRRDIAALPHLVARALG